MLFSDTSVNVTFLLSQLHPNPGYPNVIIRHTMVMAQAPNQNLEQHPACLDGEKGLWELSKQSTILVLALKLMEDLKELGVGTNEVEHEARKRAAQRWLKLGKCVENTTFGSEKLVKRDEDYVKGLLKLRADQIRKDWKMLRCCSGNN